MTIEEIRELIEVVNESGVAELEVQRGENRVRIRRSIGGPPDPGNRLLSRFRDGRARSPPVAAPHVVASGCAPPLRPAEPDDDTV